MATTDTDAAKTWVYVYVAGCDGLKSLRKHIGSDECWWKIGAVGARTGNPANLLARRMQMLVGYGALVMTEHGLVEEAGFTEWQAQQLGKPRSVQPRDDIRMLSDCIAVGLPPRLSFGMFEARLRNALEETTLHRYLGVGPADCGARYSMSNGRSAVLQTEIVCFRPQISKDVDRLLKIVATIVDSDLCASAIHPNPARPTSYDPRDLQTKHPRRRARNSNGLMQRAPVDENRRKQNARMWRARRRKRAAPARTS